MLHFLILIFLYIIFIYFVERKARHFIQSQKMSPFDDTLLTKLKWVARLFKFRLGWSNFILIFGGVVATALLIKDFSSGYLGNNGLLTGLSVGVSFITIAVAASFPGETWVKKMNIWISSISNNISVRVLKRLVFELLFIIYLVVPFLLFLFFFLLWYMNGSDSVIRLRLFFYYLPIFLVFWIYRFKDYDEFQMNVRRLIVYLFVTVAYLINNDPLSNLLGQSTDVQNSTKFFSAFGNFTVLSFLALDRIGKVAIEILSKGNIKQESKLGNDSNT